MHVIAHTWPARAHEHMSVVNEDIVGLDLDLDTKFMTTSYLASHFPAGNVRAGYMSYTLRALNKRCSRALYCRSGNHYT